VGLKFGKGKILTFGSLGVGTLPITPDKSPDRDKDDRNDETS